MKTEDMAFEVEKRRWMTDQLNHHFIYVINSDQGSSALSKMLFNGANQK